MNTLRRSILVSSFILLNLLLIFPREVSKANPLYYLPDELFGDLDLGFPLAPLGVGAFFTSYDNDLLAKAEPDECFCGNADINNGPITGAADCSDVMSGGFNPADPDNGVCFIPGNPFECSLTAGQPCQPKTNGAYVWGLWVMAGSPGTAWWGTIANTECQVAGGLTIAFAGFPFPSENDLTACEYFLGNEHLGLPDPSVVPEDFRDYRIPEIYYQYLGNDPPSTIDPAVKIDYQNDCPAGTLELAARTVGWRSAGGLESKDIVFLAGPDISGVGVNMIAFRNSTRQCLGYHTFSDWFDIRSWLQVYKRQLYTTVGQVGGGGLVLKFIGDVNDPFNFQVVGNLGGEGAYLAFHQGRIFLTTWPAADISDFTIPENPDDIGLLDIINVLGELEAASLYMSPLVPFFTGLTPIHANFWRRVWSIDEYDPYLVTAHTYGGGALASNGDELCWASIQVPGSSLIVHLLLFEPDLIECNLTTPPSCTMEQTARLEQAFENTNRPASVFCGKNFGRLFLPPTIKIIWGESSFPSFIPFFDIGWTMIPNLMFQDPLYGQSGNGKSSVYYGWAGTECNDGQIFFGFLDVGGTEGSNPFGADLYVLENGSNEPPVAVDLAGVGNPLNYGVRTEFCLHKEKYGFTQDRLLLGTANPRNLASTAATDREGGPDPFDGGWELRILQDFVP